MKTIAINEGALLKYRKVLERTLKGFPRDCCYDAAKVLEHFEGIKSVAGYYIPEGEENNPYAWIEHYWNQDAASKLEIDLTQDQFRGINKKITRNKIGEGRLKEDKQVNFDKFHWIEKYTQNLIRKVKNNL